MGLLIDTTVCVQIEREGQPPQKVLSQAGEQATFLAAITASELLHGVHRAESAVRRGRRERFVEAILSQIPILPFELEAARTHARLWADLSRTGRLIGAHDLQIAATAVTHDLTLLTANLRDFNRIGDLKVLSW